MRIWFMSDLHNHSSWPFVPPDPAPDCDVIVIAGDAGEQMSRKSIPWVAETFGRYGLPTIYVPGNHDFYGSHLIHEVRKAQLVAEHYGIHLLATGQSVVIGDTRFVGATLWTDFDLGGYGHFAELEAMKYLNDYRYIRTEAYRKTLPKDTAAQHVAQRYRIEQVLAQPFEGPTVVVTHHAPLERSLQHGRVESELDAAYASNLSQTIEQYAPELWIHGHIHRNRDYTHDRTRVVANPRGYLINRQMRGRGENRPENPDFDSALVIKV
ncbi:metallophosphoesterase [Microvirga sp. G4-2]|uniref:metallophosphoesterase n=1 Tax=Microvirga sp. G4-2 TaxID=3434467 RepID=UPI004045074C